MKSVVSWVMNDLLDLSMSVLEYKHAGFSSLFLLPIYDL